MPWYNPTGEPRKVKVGKYKALVQSYEGVWQGESVPTSYEVYTFTFPGYLMALTFTSKCPFADTAPNRSLLISV